jgi:putative heme-binding domain-containing protein
MVGWEEGLRGRALSELPQELTDQIQYYQARLGEGKLNVALRQQDPSAITEALRIIADVSANRLERLSYIKIFGEINEPECIPVLLKIATGHNYAVAVRLASLASLQHYNDDSIGRELADAYAFKIRDNPDVRSATFTVLATRANWAIDFLQLITEKRAVKKSEVPVAIVRQFKLIGNAQLDEIVDQLWPEVKLATSDEKAAAVLKIKAALQPGVGDALRGKSVYQAVCSACHRLQNEGGNIGPDLTGYDRSNLNYLVLNIVDPNADIREGYVTYTVEKKDGQVLVGTIIDRSDARVTIRTSSGAESTLAQTEIKAMTAQKTSIMPERMIEPLSDQQIRDLFAYLQQPTS